MSNSIKEEILEIYQKGWNAVLTEKTNPYEHTTDYLRWSVFEQGKEGYSLWFDYGFQDESSST